MRRVSANPCQHFTITYFTIVLYYDTISIKKVKDLRKIIPLIVSAISMVMLSGCRVENVNFRENVFKVNIGSTLSEEPGTYVRASKIALKDMKVDLSAVNTSVRGTYTATVTVNGEEYEFKIEVTDLEGPEITLKKNSFYFENGGSLKLEDVVDNVSDDSSFEYGFSDDMKLADSKKTMNQVITFDKVGTYNCEIIAKDIFNNYSVEAFCVEVVESGKLPDDTGEGINYKKYMNNNKGVLIDDINVFPADGVYYGVGNTVDSSNNRPNLAYYELKYGKYKADFIQPDSKFVWLTFNETYEYGNTEGILDTLKEKDVKAVFFITKAYAEKNPDLVKRMIEEGHILGNYTANLTNVPELSVNSLTTELNVLYNYIHETYGYDMYLFRAPSGYFSEQAMAVAQELGYRTVFWSFAYADWDVNNQPDVESALQNALDRAHGGAIYQFSGSSSTNMNMLGDFIDGMTEKGFQFAVYQKTN